MKKFLASLGFLLVSVIMFAQGYTYVKGYTRSNGTYVQGHYRTLPNNTRNDNWSTIGNVNPFTGVAGTKPGDSYYSSYSSSYSSYSLPDYSSSYRYTTPSSTYTSSLSGYGSSYGTSSYYSAPAYSTSSYYSSSTYSSTLSVSSYSSYRYSRY